MVIAPIRAATTSIHVCVKISQRRRSVKSASAPAGIVIRKTGSVVAVWTSATGSGDVASIVISQEAATVCIHVPTFERTDAIHIARNIPCRSGIHARLTGFPAGAAPRFHESAQAREEDAAKFPGSR